MGGPWLGQGSKGTRHCTEPRKAGQGHGAGKLGCPRAGEQGNPRAGIRPRETCWLWGLLSLDLVCPQSPRPGSEQCEHEASPAGQCGRSRRRVPATRRGALPCTSCCPAVCLSVCMHPCICVCVSCPPPPAPHPTPPQPTHPLKNPSLPLLTPSPAQPPPPPAPGQLSSAALFCRERKTVAKRWAVTRTKTHRGGKNNPGVPACCSSSARASPAAAGRKCGCPGRMWGSPSQAPETVAEGSHWTEAGMERTPFTYPVPILPGACSSIWPQR